MAVEAIKDGAYEFIEKPFKSERLLLSVSRALEVNLIREENKVLREVGLNNDEFIGKSTITVKIIEIVNKIAATSSRILITGESGVGKDLIAREIHKKSLVKSGPFIVINAALLEPEGIENELFGTEENNLIKHTGLFEKANNGTLFIDEVGEMPYQTQSKILRVLTEQSFSRIGGEKTINIEARIISSSTKDLELAIDSGEFRKDLYHRLNVVNLHLPKLSDRLEDLDDLIQYFSTKFSNSNGIPYKDIRNIINVKYKHHDWPGNIRELKSRGQRELIIGDRHLPLDNNNLNNELRSKECYIYAD